MFYKNIYEHGIISLKTSMKKILIILLTILTIINPVKADELKQNINMDIKIYERFINIKNYHNLGSASIWKYNSEYNDALIESLNSNTPIMTLIIN